MSPVNASGPPAKTPRAGTDSLIALALSWVCPGAGQLFAGYPRRALIFFLGVCLPFGVGMWLSNSVAIGLGGFHWFRSESPLLAAVAILPEMLAYGPTLLAMGLNVAEPIGQNPWDPGLPIAFHVGVVLTGLAGVLAALGMADAHHVARVGKVRRPHEKDSILAATLTWFVPGAGHWYLGQKGKGVMLFLTMALLFGIGVVFGGLACVYRRDYYFYWAGQVLLGAFTAFASLVFRDPVLHEFLPRADLGLLLTTSAGLLNVLLIINAYTTCERMAGREAYPKRSEDAPAGRVEPGTAEGN